MQRVWITGADGFIGRHLSHMLGAQGVEVCGLGYRAAAPAPGDPRWDDFAKGIISSDLLRALGARRGVPDVIYHLAGGGSVGASIAAPYDDFERTVRSTAAVLEWARSCAPEVRIVNVSSAAVYGGSHAGPISESARPDPFSPYGAHKRAAEILCQSAVANFGQNIVTVRPFSIFGTGLRKQLLWDCCSRVALRPSHLTVGGTGEEVRDWLPVAALCDILVRMGGDDVGPGTIVNAGTGHGIAVRQIIIWLLQAWDQADLPVDYSGISRRGDPISLIAQTSRLHALDIDIAPTSAADIAAYVKWFQAL